MYVFSMLTMCICAQTKGRSLEEMEIIFGSKETAFAAKATRRRAGEDALEPEERFESFTKTG